MVLTLLSSCTTVEKPNSMELQAFQRQEFATSKNVAFGSVVSVLQDLGYIISTANKDTGLITAGSPITTVVFFGSHMSNTKVNAFVESFAPKRTAIRLTFVEVKESPSGYGMKSKVDKPNYDKLIYQNAFEKIGEAIFIREKALEQN
ncbi:MAG: hypothetical protein HN553_10735 [Opitutae bacterium]|nr:hypothetical protein [Opitutae bacterium]